MGSEEQALIPQGAKGGETTLLGTKITLNDDPWNFVFVLPADVDANKDLFAAEMPDAEVTWNKIFTGFKGTGQLDKSVVKKGMTRKMFHSAVVQELISMFCGPRCGFQVDTMTTIDGDEVFLKVGLTDKNTTIQLADREKFQAALLESAYGKEYAGSKFALPTENGSGNGEFALDKDEVHKSDNAHPAYVQVDEEIAEHLADFSNADIMRLVRRRIQTLIAINALVNSGVCLRFFAVHRWSSLQDLHNVGWNDPKRLIYWPRETNVDMVRNKLGAEVGFFFHWYNFFTRWLALPAVISMFTFTARKVGPIADDEEKKQLLNIVFACFVAVWSALFLARYEQVKNLKVLKWGMQGASESGAAVRKEFSDAYRGTFRDRMQHGLHWFLLFVFIAEAVGFTGWLSQLRSLAYHDKAGVTWGMSNVTFVTVAKYVTTVNIKVVDKSWAFLSAYLTKQENWRTVQELKAAMTTKLAIVKLFVFFYPFLYIVLLQPFVEGCPGDNGNAGCLHLLQDNLIVLFVTQLATEFATTGAYILLVVIPVKLERDKRPNSEYTYLELQAKAQEYDAETEILDFMTAVLNFGFIALFANALPFICALCFVFNFPMKRILAFKISYVYNCPVPRSADGIGAWAGILSALAYMGVTFNCYISIFFLPLLNHWKLSDKLILFLAVEHILIVLKILMEKMMGEKSIAQTRIQEHHEDTVEKIMEGLLGGGGKTVTAKETKKPDNPYK
eukprot:TRINITY_DN7613_c0_g1_i2.p1 TRINITY_DN7613_c0_g1~~TRINITY_DN7613_c0_g1_i2.p1  ORF type:complete len:730 (-),score=139.92 TRINITY_DN7613_c0_g1_i2:104-2293(-)